MCIRINASQLFILSNRVKLCKGLSLLLLIAYSASAVAQSGTKADTAIISKITALKEVKVRPSVQLQALAPNISKAYRTHMEPFPNHEFAQYIPNEHHIGGFISSVTFEMNDDVKAIDQPFNVEILAKSIDSIFPDTALLRDSLIVYNTARKDLFTVDLSKYHIAVPDNGFFVIFQTLSPSCYSKEQVWYNNEKRFKVPGINIYLNAKDRFAGNCCDIEPNIRNGFYCLIGGDRQHSYTSEKKSHWIVYEQGINLGITTTISQ
jgi:hypothetical protein